ncbi:lytic murein transglycosylase [Klebsiella pneumoniae]
MGEGENYYIVTENYQALLQWNRSRYFATAVGTLADRIAGRQ